jgi:hypothetical protein
MTTDLVKRLRGDALSQEQLWTLRDAAADRIEQLELALRWIAAMTPDPEFGTPPTEVAVAVARNALEGKDD